MNHKIRSLLRETRCMYDASAREVARSFKFESYLGTARSREVCRERGELKPRVPAETETSDDKVSFLVVLECHALSVHYRENYKSSARTTSYICVSVRSSLSTNCSVCIRLILLLSIYISSHYVFQRRVTTKTIIGPNHYPTVVCSEILKIP
jgi:hypothetical protein